jgi:hypothetical protein
LRALKDASTRSITMRTRPTRQDVQRPVALCPAVARAQGRLDQIHHDANSSDSAGCSTSSSSSSNSSSSKGHKSDNDSDSFLGELLGAIFQGIGEGIAESVRNDDDDAADSSPAATLLLFPFWLPHHLLRDDLSRYGYFPAYPYPDVYPGYLWQGRWPHSMRDQVPKGSEPEGIRWWSIRVSGEDGNDFRGMNRAGLRATVDTASRFGIQSNWNFLTETLPCGCHDNTVLGDTSLTYRFAQHEQLHMYTGLGFRVLTDRSVTDWGVNFLYGLDFFPAKPVVISALFDAGNVGSAGVVHARGTLGVVKNHFEFFGGYDFIRIGSVNVQGPMLGLRLWF